MAYKVIRFFYDLSDGNYEYHVGDSFPRKGKAVSDARIKELLSDKNRLRTPVIQAVARKKKGE